MGDRLYTDVKTGVANGAHGILVLSGETKAGDLENADTVPDAVFTGLKEIAAHIAPQSGINPARVGQLISRCVARNTAPLRFKV